MTDPEGSTVGVGAPGSVGPTLGATSVVVGVHETRQRATTMLVYATDMARLYRRVAPTRHVRMDGVGCPRRKRPRLVGYTGGVPASSEERSRSDDEGAKHMRTHRARTLSATMMIGALLASIPGTAPAGAEADGTHAAVWNATGERLRVGSPAEMAAAVAKSQDWNSEGGYIPMSDGTTLRYQVLFPHEEDAGPGPWPLVIDYSGYRPADEFWDGVHRTFLAQGYAVAGVNVRGTGCSEGEFDFFEDQMAWDGYEMVEWLAGRPYVRDRRVGMVGKSYPGISQLTVGSTNPPSLRAIVPGHILGDVYRDVAYPGGIQNFIFAAGWSFVSQPVPSYTQAAEGIQAGDMTCTRNQVGKVTALPYQPFIHASGNRYDNEFFHARGNYWTIEHFGPDRAIRVPTMLMLSWQDEQVGSRGMNMTERLHPDNPWKVVASNGDHGEYYGGDVLAEIYRFLNVHLRGEIPAGDPLNPDPEAISEDDDPIAFAAARDAYNAEPRFAALWEVHRADGNGRLANFVTRHDSWPPPEAAVERLFLHPGSSSTDGALSAARPTGAAGAVSYRYTPLLGTQGPGGSLADDAPTGGGFARVPDLNTVAAFTSHAFEEDVTMLGRGSLDLWLSSTAPDTDLEVMVTEVRPDGTEIYVNKGWLRASHAELDLARSHPAQPFQTHRLEDVAALTPERIINARVEIFPVGHVFREGSRLRVWVQAPGLTSELWGMIGEPTPAMNTIHISDVHESSLAFEVLPGFQAPAATPDCDTVRSMPCRPDPLG